MQFCCPSVDSKNKGDNRRHSISISSLLNDTSIDPIQKSQEHTMYQPNYFQYYHQNDSPLSNTASLANSITEPDLVNHLGTGMHHINNGQIIVSSLAKAKRKRILPYQYKRLMAILKNTDTPSSEIRSQLAQELDMTKREVQVWFQNRRAKANRNKLNRDNSTNSVGHRRHSDYSHLYYSSKAIYKMVLESPYHPPSKPPLLSPNSSYH